MQLHVVFKDGGGQQCLVTHARRVMSVSEVLEEIGYQFPTTFCDTQTAIVTDSFNKPLGVVEYLRTSPASITFLKYIRINGMVPLSRVIETLGATRFDALVDTTDLVSLEVVSEAEMLVQKYMQILEPCKKFKNPNGWVPCNAWLDWAEAVSNFVINNSKCYMINGQKGIPHPELEELAYGDYEASVSVMNNTVSAVLFLNARVMEGVLSLTKLMLNQKFINDKTVEHCAALAVASAKEQNKTAAVFVPSYHFSVPGVVRTGCYTVFKTRLIEGVLN